MNADKHRSRLFNEKKESLGDLSVLNPITEKIIGCAYTVSNTLGAGFLEKVYKNALAHEIRKAGLKVVQQQPFRCGMTASWRASISPICWSKTASWSSLKW